MGEFLHSRGAAFHRRVDYVPAERDPLREPTNRLACRHSPAAVLT